jgi:hypothetical protein
MRRSEVSERVGDLRQLASIRRIVLDDGHEQGVRALAFSTGGGLDFWVLVDRSLDIGPLWWRGLPIAPQGPVGFQHPKWNPRDGEGGRNFRASFAGFLVTCGLEHIRQPANGHPMHGRLPFTPAAVGRYGADWQRDPPILFCEGDVLQKHAGSEHFLLKRRIEAEIGGTKLSIHDTVENLAATPQQQASLYHFNVGYPALDDGAVVEHAGRRRLGPLRLPDDGASREAFSMPVSTGDRATCVVTCPKMTLDFGWDAETLPHLQLWHDLGPGACVLSVEPCTSERLPGGRSGEEPMVEPGETRAYALDISIGESSSWD